MQGQELVGIWMWTEGADPDAAYIRQVLEAAVPAARGLGGRVPVQSARVDGPWPADFWPYALARLDPALTDHRQYELTGWAGADARSAAHLFVVSAYRLPLPAPSPASRMVLPPGPPLYAPTYGAPPAPIPAHVYPHQTGISAAELSTGYGGYYAGFGPRLVAGLVDGVVLGLLELAVALIGIVLGRKLLDPSDDSGGGPLLLSCGGLALGGLVLFAYLADFWAWRGQTLGMMLMGLRVVLPDGSKPRLGRAALRAIGWVMSLLTLGIGFLLIAGDERRQGLADRMAGTYVIPVHPPPGPRPPGLPGYPAESSSPTPSPAPEPNLPPPSPTDEGGAGTPLFVGEGGGARAGAAPLQSPAETAWQRGLDLLAEGSRAPGGDRALMIVEPEAGQAAAAAFAQAVAVAPDSPGYRYWLGVARRYGEGYAAAAPDFAQALQQDPAFWEARMQGYFGPRWHDAFAYPSWTARAGSLPPPLHALLPDRPGSRLVLVREGASRLVAVLTLTRRGGWKAAPGADLPARIEAVAGYSPSGLVIALYVALRDDPQQPYRGETFINPAEGLGPATDATALGQNLLLALARQPYTYLIFADETGALLLNRRLVFDPATRQGLAAVAGQAQAAAYGAIERNQPMTLDAFQQAARWHMGQFPLERVQF